MVVKDMYVADDVTVYLADDDLGGVVYYGVFKNIPERMLVREVTRVQISKNMTMIFMKKQVVIDGIKTY